MSLNKFIIWSLAVFAIERLPGPLFGASVMLFPALMAYWLVISQANVRIMISGLLLAVLFGLFSGFPLVFYWLAILAMSLSVMLAFRFFAIERRSLLSVIIYSEVFFIIFLWLFVFQIPALIILKSLPIHIASAGALILLHHAID